MKGKASIGTVMMMWTFTMFLAYFWYYLPEYLAALSDVFLVVALISSALSFSLSVRRKKK